MKKKTFYFAGIIACIISITLVSSCLKDYDLKKLAGVEWNPDLAAPLAYSSLTIRDILAKTDKNGNFSIDAQNFVTLVYKGNLLSLKAEDFLVFPNQNTSNSFTLSAAEQAALLLGTVTVPFSQVISFNTGSNTKVDSLLLKGGKFLFSLTSDFQHSGSITLTIPTAIKNGNPLTMTIPVIYSGSIVNISDSVDLTGYDINMTTASPAYNQIPVNISLTMTNSGAPVTPSSSLSFVCSLNNIKFHKLFGSIDQQVLSPDADTVNVDIFNNSLGGGTFTLVEPKFIVTISNAYGVQIFANFQKFQGYNSNRNPSTIDILGSGIPNPLPIPSPNISQLGQSILSSFTLDKNNSNIVNAINFAPPYVIYQLSSGTIPPVAPNTNFVLDTSYFKVDMEIELPLYGTGFGFTVQDTLENVTFELTDQVESFLLRTFISNGFPCEVKVQVYFADSLFNRLDSLMTSLDPSQQIIMAAAEVDGNSRVTGPPKEKTTDVLLTLDRVKHLKSMKYLLIKGEGMSTNNAGHNGPNVKIYSDYLLSVKMGAQAKLKVIAPLSKK